MVLLKLVAAVAGVVVWDWLGATRVGAYATTFDYRYWPLSLWRIMSVVLLAGTVAILVISARPDPVNPPLWSVAVGGAALAVWGTVVILDWFGQRRTGYRVPQRYSDRDD